MDAGSEDSEETAELLKLEMGEWLCEYVCDHVVGRAILQRDMTVGDSLSNKMKMNVDMLGAAVECGILGKSDSTLVITEKSSRYCKKKNRRKFSK